MRKETVICGPRSPQLSLGIALSALKLPLALPRCDTPSPCNPIVSICTQRQQDGQSPARAVRLVASFRHQRPENASAEVAAAAATILSNEALMALAQGSPTAPHASPTAGSWFGRALHFSFEFCRSCWSLGVPSGHPSLPLPTCAQEHTITHPLLLFGNLDCTASEAPRSPAQRRSEALKQKLTPLARRPLVERAGFSPVSVEYATCAAPWPRWLLDY